MAITTPPEITPYPEAPQRNQAESVFVPLANAFVASLEPRRVEMQALADWMKTAGDYIDTKITDNKTAIDTVHASIADVNTVADDIANVNTTAANISDVNTVATNIADVNKVAAIDGDVSIVAASDLAVNTVATDIANVNTTAGSIANVNAVGADIANVNTTATNIADVNTVATDILSVQAAAALSKRQSLYARSLALNPPLANETLRLDYANRAYGLGDKTTGLIDDIRSFAGAQTLTRATPKWVFDATGTLVEVPADEPAYQYDPVTGEALGLSLEGQATNEFVYGDFSGSNGSNVTVSPASDPFFPNAHVVTANNNYTGHTQTTFGMQYPLGTTGGALGSLHVVYVKYNGSARYAGLRTTSGPAGLTVDLVTGEVVNSSTAAKAVMHRSGWIELSRFIVGGTAVNNQFYVTIGNSYSGYNITAVTGDSALVAYPSAYDTDQHVVPSITPTAGSQVTRAADVVSRTLGAEYNAEEGSLSVTAAVPAGETVIALGSESIVSDSDAEKAYTLSYNADPSATSLDIAPNASVATVKSITYTPRSE